MEETIQQLLHMNPLWICGFALLVAYIENIFPPFPSDAAIVAVGSLVAAGSVDLFSALLCSTIGSTLGFVTMFKVGGWFGHSIIERGKLRFLPLDQVHKVEHWFHKYGYWVVVGNRFLSGTRAIVSFFAGLSDLSLFISVVLSFISAMLWNGILLFAGKTLGQNWRAITIFFEAYGKAATSIVILVVLAFVIRYIYRRQAKTTADTSAPSQSPKP